MDSYLSYVSVLGSAASMAATGYFWLVRMRDERPSLTPYLLDKEFFLGTSRDNVRQIGVKFGVVVANDSTLPNAILGARLSVRTHDGWMEVGNVGFDKQTPLPINTPSMQTVLLRLTGTLSFPYHDEIEGTNGTMASYLEKFLAQPLEVKLELKQLKQSATEHILAMPAESTQSAQGLRLHSKAA